MGTNASYQGRIEDDRLTTGAGEYVADIELSNVAHAIIIRAQQAHGALLSVDTTDAAALPGVLAIYTATDLAADGIGDQPCGVELPRPDGQPAFQAGRRILARERVRHLGEPVALVVAESRAAALEAAENVIVEIDDEPVAVTAEDAVREGAPLVWAEVPGNVAFEWSKGDPTAADAELAACAHVTELDSHVTRVMAQTMEPRGCLAFVDNGGRLVVHPSNQNPYPLRAGLSAMLGLPTEQIQIVVRDVGGSFGMKSGVYPEDVLIAWATRKLGRPVRWIAERSEGFLSDEHGRDVRIRTRLGLDADGHFKVFKVDCDINVGAYLSGRSLGFIYNLGGIAGVYRTGTIAAEVRGIHTHTQVTAPYRGAGRPEATFAIERTIDLAASELGIDPFELRQRNLVPPEAMPYDTGFIFTYDCGEFEQNMLAAAELIDRDSFESRRAQAAQRGRLRGLGISNPIEIAAGPLRKPGKDYSKVTVKADGTIDLHTGVVSVGQGIETLFTNLAAERLGVATEQVRYSQGDTDNLPGGRGNGGSSSTAVGGSSLAITLDRLIETGREFAASMLQANADDIEFADAAFTVRGTGASAGLFDVARFAAEQQSDDGLTASGEFDPSTVTFPNGCHMCEVEIDPETGQCDVVDYAVVEDIGTVLNPTLARGQMHGGIAMGLGQALFEQVIYDGESGQLSTGSFMDYTMPRADDLPTMRFETRAVPTKVNPLGAKGIGEAGSVGSISAVINAVCDALRPLGVHHIDMPATPARIWQAIQDAKQRKAA